MPSLSAAKNANCQIKLDQIVAVVIGGTAGIGAALANIISSHSNAPVVHIVGRSEDSAAKVIERLKQTNARGIYRFHRCNVSLVKESKSLLARLQDEPSIKERGVNYLVLTPGILSMKGRTETAEGNDIKMMLHLYSRALFARDLSPQLARAAQRGEQSRVISVLDSKRADIAGVDFDDLDLKRRFSLSAAAAHCLAMTDVYLEHLASQYPNVAYSHAYPGIVDTSLFQSMPTVFKPFAWALSKVAAVSADDCAEYLFYAFARPEYSSGFRSVSNQGDLYGEIQKPAKMKASPEQASKVWDHIQTVVA